MSEEIILLAMLGLGFLVLPFLLGIVIGRRISAAAAVTFSLVLLAVLLCVAWWIYHNGPETGYGPEFAAGLFLIYVGVPVFVSTIAALAVGQWLRVRRRRE